MLTMLAKLLQALNSENSSRQIAAAVALAFVFGLSPLLSLQAFLILFIVLFIKVHLTSFILAAGLFKGLSFVLSGLTVSVGERLLTSESLSSLFQTLYQFDLFKLAHWHHTYNLGALVLGSVVALALYFITRMLIEKYRQHIKSYLDQLPLIKALKATKLYTVYLHLAPQGNS